jgi:hypothetical protein
MQCRFVYRYRKIYTEKHNSLSFSGNSACVDSNAMMFSWLVSTGLLLNKRPALGGSAQFNVWAMPFNIVLFNSLMASATETPIFL